MGISMANHKKVLAQKPQGNGQKDVVSEQSIILSNQGRDALTSWFKVSHRIRWLAWGFSIMSVSMVFFAIASRGTEASFFWQKIAFIIIASSVLTFISVILRMMVYSGTPIPGLRDDLLITNDGEKIVTANNFYITMTKLLLIPTLTIIIAFIATQSHILDIPTLMTTGSLASLTGLIFIIALMMNTAILSHLYIFLIKVRKGNAGLIREFDDNTKS